MKDNLKLETATLNTTVYKHEKSFNILKVLLGIILALIIAILVVVLLTFIGKIDLTSISSSNKNKSTLKTVTVNDDMTDVKSVDIDSIEYTPILINELEEEFNKNPFRANNKYLGEYVEIKCKLDSAYSSGMTLLVYELNDIREYPFTIICNITLDEHADILFKLDDNEPLIIKGRVTNVDNMLGYTIEVHNILYDIKQVRALKPEYDTTVHGVRNYEHISIDELYRQLYENAFRANKNLNGKYIETKCTISTIDADGRYITIDNIGTGEIKTWGDLSDAIDNWADDIAIDIKCNIASSVDDNMLEIFNCGSEVVIRGQIKEVNYPGILDYDKLEYIYNYVIDIDYINYE